MESPANDRPDLTSILTDLEANEAAIDRLTDGLDDHWLNWRPSARSWSIAQCIEHLARSNRDYLSGALNSMEKLKPGLNAGHARIQPTTLERIFIRIVEPPVRVRAKTPQSAMPPASVDPAQAKAEFLRTHADARMLINAAARLDLNRIQFPNPFFTAMPVRAGTALLIVAAHERRHIWQAGNVRRALGEKTR